MKQESIEQAQAFRQFLMDNDINYKELSLVHFHIYSPDGVLIAQVWPTTQKCMWESTKSTLEGMEAIKQQLLQKYTKLAASVDDRNQIRKEFESYADQIPYARKLITVTELASGALETQINDSKLLEKYQYIWNAYDAQMRLKSNIDIRILDFIIV